MRVLLDECVPKKLKSELSDNNVSTVAEMGWGGVKNGTLLKLASEEFDIFLTVDQNLPYQQNAIDLPLPIVVLVAHSNDIDKLRPLMSEVRSLLPRINERRIYTVEAG